MTKLKNKSYQIRNPRPNPFQFFDSGQKNFSPKKWTFSWKKFWKYCSYFVITFLISMSLLGCIQPFFIPVSKKVGVGFELYSSKNKVSPYVAVVKYDAKERLFNLSPDSLDRAQNVFLGSHQKDKGDNQINQQIIEKTQEQSGDFYFQGALRIAIQIQDQNQNSIVYKEEKNPSQFLAFVSNQLSYKPISTFTQIDFFRLNNLISEPGEIPKTTFTWSAFSLKKDEVFSRSQDLFARDVLQILFDKTKAKLTEEFGDNFSQALSKLKSKNFNLNKQEQEAIFYYNKAILHYLTFLNFALREPNEIVINTEREFPPLYVGFPNEPVQSWFVSSWKEVWNYGPFYALFVWPIFMSVEKISSTSSNWSGWGIILSIIIVVIVTKLLQFLFTFKTIFSQFKLEELKPKKALIEAKYDAYGKHNKFMMQKKHQEIRALYKKYNISPFGSLLPAILTTPVLISVWRVFISSPEVKSTIVANIQFSETSYLALLSGQWQYIFIILLALIIQITSLLLPKILNRKKLKLINVYETAALKKQNKIQNIMTFAFAFISVFFQAGVQFYWVLTGIWTIGQNLFVHYFQKTNFFKIKIKPKL